MGCLVPIFKNSFFVVKNAENTKNLFGSIFCVWKNRENTRTPFFRENQNFGALFGFKNCFKKEEPNRALGF